MSVYDRTANMVKAWAGMQKLPLADDALENLWSTYGRQFAFYPEACQVLVGDVLRQFPNRKELSSDLKTPFFYDSQVNTSGTIKTADDLAELILSSPEGDGEGGTVKIISLLLVFWALTLSARLSSQCTYMGYKILSPSLIAVRCDNSDGVAQLKGTASLSTSTATGTVVPYLHENNSWLLVDLGTTKLEVPKKYSLTLHFMSGDPTQVSVDTTSAFTVVLRTQAKPRDFTFAANMLIEKTGTCYLTVHDALGRDRAFEGTLCRTGLSRTPKTPEELKGISDLENVGKVYLVRSACTQSELRSFISETGFQSASIRAD